MKNTVRIATLSALLAAAPAFAATKPAKVPAKPAVPPSALMQAFTSLSSDLKAAIGGGTDMIVRLDKLNDASVSAATKAQAKLILGEAMPSGIERQAAIGGGTDYSFTLKPGSYTAPEGGGLRWSELTVKESMDKDLSHASGNARWPQLAISGKTMQVTVNDMRMDGKQERAVAGSEVWTGSATGSAASVVAQDSSMPGFVMNFDDISYTVASSMRGKLIDLAYQSAVKRIALMGGQVDDMHFNFRMVGLDVATLAKLAKLNSMNKHPMLNPDKALEDLLPALRSLAQSARTNNTAFEIDDISMAFQGNRVGLTGRLSIAPGSDADFATLPALGKKIDAKLTVTVPTALILDVAKLFARKQMSANPQAVVDEAAVNQMAESMRDMGIGKIMGSGFGRLENDVLIIPIEVHDGVITLNGKTVEMPKQPAPAQAPAAPAAKAKGKTKK